MVELADLKETFKKLEDKKRIIWGTGSSGKDILNFVFPLGISYFVDNNSSRWDQTVFDDFRCYSPDTLLAENPDHIAIIVASEFYTEINRQLTDMGFCENVHYFNGLNILRPLVGKFVPGHFHSPIPSLPDILSRKSQIFQSEPPLGIPLYENEQVELFTALKTYWNQTPFPAQKSEDHRYYYDNHFFQFWDANVMHSMIRHLKPGKIVEVGCGYSSAAILDTTEKHFGGSIDCTFIEPYPDRFLSLIKLTNDYKLIPSIVQEVPLHLFEELSEHEILSFDTSHISKIGSDVNHFIFEILPRLQKGVVVHIHDVLYPFEYPISWIQDYTYWNEAYLLRAFLQNNACYKIKLWPDYLSIRLPELFDNGTPQGLGNYKGSLWIEKIA
ncbi:class I SAM-dependent methyltransferase [Cohnella caldifontis]|uniref:class I SAM-dependent methyltransferase n=1 Tax=Cohnella caldifontis TaxID=3027471 RepID=UPI0023EC9D1B|nr:class I SAM-dependent methyltransferase [Cohnella sp. YIM B05605]